MTKDLRRLADRVNELSGEQITNYAKRDNGDISENVCQLRDQAILAEIKEIREHLEIMQHENNVDKLLMDLGK